MSMLRERTQSNGVWFSKVFKLNKPQYELNFVDFRLDADVPLYIDPYAITKDRSELAVECHNAIISFFQELLKAINSNNVTRVASLVRGHWAEPSEIHLGVGKKARRGKGMGAAQEQQVVNALANSSAARAGAIQDIQELELHIEGIGPDKISDLVANLILAHLAKFTEETCQQLKIPTRLVAVSRFWNQERLEWDGAYFQLPVYFGHSYILVPKRFLRRDKHLMNHREFYEKYVLDIIQQELLRSDDSLVYTLRNGQRRVTKKDIKNDPRFHASKDFISRFIVEHPEAIEKYRKDMLQRFRPTDPAMLSGKSVEDDPKVQDALARLDSLKPGSTDANAYHDAVFTLLEFIFDYALENFTKENKMDQGRSRIDIVADNRATEGLFTDLRTELNATFVPMECKNYTDDLGNTEFNQLVDRMGPTTSSFGILFCRKVKDKQAMLKHRADRYLRKQGVILLIDDDALKSLVNWRLLRKYDKIEAYLRARIREVKLGDEIAPTN